MSPVRNAQSTLKSLLESLSNIQCEVYVSAIKPLTAPPPFRPTVQNFHQVCGTQMFGVVWEFPLLQCQDAGSIPSPAQWVKGSGIAAAVAWITAVAQIQSLAWELPYALGRPKKKTKTKTKTKKNSKAKPMHRKTNAWGGLKKIKTRKWIWIQIDRKQRKESHRPWRVNEHSCHGSRTMSHKNHGNGRPSKPTEIWGRSMELPHRRWNSRRELILCTSPKKNEFSRYIGQYDQISKYYIRDIVNTLRM